MDTMFRNPFIWFGVVVACIGFTIGIMELFFRAEGKK